MPHFDKSLETDAYAFFLNLFERDAGSSGWIPISDLVHAAPRSLPPGHPLVRYVESEAFFDQRSHFFRRSKSGYMVCLQEAMYRKTVEVISALLVKCTHEGGGVSPSVEHLVRVMRDDGILINGQAPTSKAFVAFVRENPFYFKLGFNDLLVSLKVLVPSTQEIIDAETRMFSAQSGPETVQPAVVLPPGILTPDSEVAEGSPPPDHLPPPGFSPLPPQDSTQNATPLVNGSEAVSPGLMGDQAIPAAASGPGLSEGGGLEYPSRVKHSYCQTEKTLLDYTEKIYNLLKKFAVPQD